jgi:hypothetical protein
MPASCCGRAAFRTLQTVRVGLRALIVTALLAALGAEPAGAFSPNPAIEHLQYRYGPLSVIPGQNLILIGSGMPLPGEDGYIVGIRPSLILTDGSVPPVTQVHLHHGVIVNGARQDSTDPQLPERVFATGEEKTYVQLPDGYGYPYRAKDAGSWLMNYMIHNLTPTPETVYMTYDIDFVPARAPLAKTIRPVRPVWMDVRNGQAYPVFDALRGGSHNGVYTYPAQRPAGHRALNEWTVDRPGTLILAAGHLHPGGLYDELDLQRAGASPAPPAPCAKARRRHHRHRAHRRARARGACPVPVPIAGVKPGSVRLFRSEAVNYDPLGRVSWDMSMTATDPGWRVAVRAGDRLSISTAYDTSRASWYESMGIMMVFMADDATGLDPFKSPLATSGHVTHGPLPENHSSGGRPQGLPDPATLPAAQAPASIVDIAGFAFVPGDQAGAGPLGAIPTISRGRQLTFFNADAAAQIFHTVTACRRPCNLSTGASYPLADGPTDFDSGELGFGPPGFTAASNRASWRTPAGLTPGTYSFFCRIHPFMRGAFRVLG